MRLVRKRRYIYRTLPLPRPQPQINGHQLSGDELKAIGMAVAEAAVPDWSDLAKHTLFHVIAPNYATFHSEILTDLIGKPRGATGQHRNNAVGSIFNGAARRGMIKAVDRMNAKNPESHSNNRNLWEWTGMVFTARDKRVRPCPHCPGYITITARKKT